MCTYWRSSELRTSGGHRSSRAEILDPGRFATLSACKGRVPIHFTGPCKFSQLTKTVFAALPNVPLSSALWPVFFCVIRGTWTSKVPKIIAHSPCILGMKAVTLGTLEGQVSSRVGWGCWEVCVCQTIVGFLLTQESVSFCSQMSSTRRLMGLSNYL